MNIEHNRNEINNDVIQQVITITPSRRAATTPTAATP